MTATEQSRPRTIRRSVQSNGLCVLTFDRPGGAANILDWDTLLELEEELAFLESETRLRGLVLGSAKPSVFIAGADLSAFRAGTPLDRIRSIIECGQAVMNRLAALSIPTAAAIHGAALGGGCELALACDYRLASDERATRLGLPETQLGLLPAWGGSTRLPRLVGLSRALEMILGGKPLSAREAFACGLVDELTSRETLLDTAFRKLAAGKCRRPRHWLLNSPLAAAWSAKNGRRRWLARTHALYPAPLKALEVVTQGVLHSRDHALAAERSAFLDLVQTDACHNLVELFFLESRAKRPDLAWVFQARAGYEMSRRLAAQVSSLLYRRLPAGGASKEAAASAGWIPATTQARNPRYPTGATPWPEPTPITRAAVIGAGVMGAGIAQWLSARKVTVSIEDVGPEQLASGMKRIQAIYQEKIDRNLATPREMEEGLARIQPAADGGGLAKAEMVIEAAAEDLAVKQEIFRRADEQAPADAILATNTSALPVAELARSTRHPQRVVGLHFFNPVHRMPLVEVIAAPQTAPEILHRTVRFAQQIGKLPVIVKDSPGFVANRLLTPYLNEAQALFESGVPVAQLDKAMLDFGLPMGPMRLLDEIGLDVELHIAETLAARFGDHMAVPACLREAVRAGWTGRKSGRGFYLHTEPRPIPPNLAMGAFAHSPAGPPLSREELQERLLFVLVNEAARCLEEGIVSGPEDIDFVMVKGTGFPPFRGGPLRYADRVGAERFAGAMDHLANAGIPRFAPCALLRHLAVHGKTFYPAVHTRHEQPLRKAA